MTIVRLRPDVSSARGEASGPQVISPIAANLLRTRPKQIFKAQSAKRNGGCQEQSNNGPQNSALAKCCSLLLLLREPSKGSESHRWLNWIHTAESSSTQYPARL